MCELQTLSYYKDGYVARCNHCGYMRVAFGTGLFHVSPKDFAWLLDVLRMICSKEEVRAADEYKNILVPTPYPEMQIVLSPAEAFRLLAILEEADNEMKAGELLQLFGQ